MEFFSNLELDICQKKVYNIVRTFVLLYVQVYGQELSPGKTNFYIFQEEFYFNEKSFNGCT